MPNTREPLTPRIRLSPGPDDSIAASPITYLDKAAWSRYVAICGEAGCRYRAPQRAHIGPLDALTRLVETLRSAGFAIHVTRELEQLLHEQAAAMRRQVDAMRQTEREVQAALAARGLQLWPFQREGVAWLRSRHVGLLADEMGLGKTVQTLMAIPGAAAGVIVCPAIAKGVWQTEGHRWRPDLRYTIRTGRRSFRWPAPGEFVIVNYDILPDTVPDDPPDGLVVIADEAHVLKSASAKRSQRFKLLAAAARATLGRCWLLTGTPILNRKEELWTLLNHVGLATEAFGSAAAYHKLFDFSGHPKPELALRLRRVCLKRHRREVLPDLPTKTYQSHLVAVDEVTTRLCDEMVDVLRREGIDIKQAVSLSLNGDAFAMMSRVRAALATAKIPTMLGLVDDHEHTGEPMVVFSAHRAPISVLAARPGWRVITGDVDALERAEIQRLFQAGRLRGVGITIKAGGVALTLTRARLALFVDLEWSPKLNEQAEDRICRIGQDRGVLITRLVADHDLDRHVTRVLHRKQTLIAASVDRSAVSAGHATAQREREAAALEALAGAAARRRAA